MKWFKHISDSLDDPFIFELMDKFGADGYLVFFGTIEIYSREFKPDPGWELIVNRSFLKQKFHKRQDTIIIKCLHYIATHGKLPTNSDGTHDKLVPNSQQTRDELMTNSCETPYKLDLNSKKVFKNSGKWDIGFDGTQVSIFIPKFTRIIDDWTGRKLRSDSVDTPKKHKPIKNIDKEVRRKKQNKNNIYSESFETFWNEYPKQKSKGQAFKTWNKLLKSKTLPNIETLIISLQTLKSSNEWLKSKGKYIPYPSSWLNAGGWDDNPNINMPDVSDTLIHNHNVMKGWLKK